MIYRVFLQCCGSAMPVSRIRSFHRGSGFFHPRSSSNNLSILTQKIVSKFSEIWSGLFIQDPDHDFLPIPDPGVKKAPDSGSWIRICNTGFGKMKQSADKRKVKLLDMLSYTSVVDRNPIQPFTSMRMRIREANQCGSISLVDIAVTRSGNFTYKTKSIWCRYLRYYLGHKTYWYLVPTVHMHLNLCAGWKSGFLLILASHPNTDPDQADQKHCGSGSTTLIYLPPARFFSLLPEKKFISSLKKIWL